jgi:hypothetical protein
MGANLDSNCIHTMEQVIQIVCPCDPHMEQVIQIVCPCDPLMEQVIQLVCPCDSHMPLAPLSNCSSVKLVISYKHLSGSAPYLVPQSSK